MSGCLVGAALLESQIFPGSVEVLSVGAESKHRWILTLWAAPFLPKLAGALSTLPGSGTLAAE